MCFFSVIIPVYNREHLIREALDSVFAQTFRDFEVIVVDDGSTDGTVEVVESYPESVQLIQQSNAGPGVARNTGVDKAEGTYVAFLDSDDQWFPWTLETYKNAIDGYSEPSLLSGPITYFSDPNELEDSSARPVNISPYEDFFHAASEGLYVSTGQSVVKTSAFRSAGGFTHRNINAEDHDLAFRLGNMSGYVHIASPALVGVRRHEGQVTTQHNKTWRGLMYILDREEQGVYPGGDSRKWERRYLLCQHVRSTSISLLRAGHIQKAWALYRRTLQWQVHFRRVKYLLGFPVLLIKALVPQFG